MLIPIGGIFLVLSVALLLFGTLGQKPAALYALKCVWLPGLLIAVYLTMGAWMDRSYSENWAAYGIIFFVLPYTGLVLIEGILELVLLRGTQGAHAKAARIVTAVFIGLLLICSIVGVLSA